MKQVNNIKVYYADTDAYGVVWHGSYLRWLEAGRVDYTDKILGLSLSQMQAQGCVLPVVELNVKYKSSARLDDELVLETEIEERRKSAIIFKQTLKNAKTDKINIVATVVCVAVDTTTNKMMRTLPNSLMACSI